MTQPDPPRLEQDEAARLARALAGLLEVAHTALGGGGAQGPAARLASGHLGVPLPEAILMSADMPVWQHVSAHRAAAAHIAEVTPAAEWFGVAAGSGMPRQHAELMGILAQEGRGRAGDDVPSRPDYVTAPTGPDSTDEVISFGLVCTRSPAGAPVVLALRTSQMHGPVRVMFEVLCADRADGGALLARLAELIDEHDVIRGQVVSFGASEHYGNELVTFLPRPTIPAVGVILPAGVLSAIERHVIGPAQHAERLRAARIHLKRGLLLHGPPGTGKTHTVRYLMGRLAGSTVIVLSGMSLRFIEEAAALARRLAPSVIVIEDVDLVAIDRSFSPTGNPLLFTLLDAMDGVAADVDVTFVLTTNRAADLETALSERPGRIDLAVEIPRPDAGGRRRLFDLYRGAATIAADLEPAVAATEGATASAIKELMRRAVLAALDTDSGAGRDPVAIDDEVLARVLSDYASERESLSRALLGAGGSADDGREQGPAVEASAHPRPGRMRPAGRAAFGWTAYRPR